MISVVEKAGADCFATCNESKAAAHTSAHKTTVHTTRGTKCWTDCFYDTVIGPRSNETVYSDGTKQGMRAEDLTSAWLAAFRSEDHAKGGCPNVNVDVES